MAAQGGGVQKSASAHGTVPNYLILMSEYLGVVLGTPRIPEVSEVVWEFGSKSRTGV